MNKQLSGVSTTQTAEAVQVNEPLNTGHLNDLLRQQLRPVKSKQAPKNVNAPLPAEVQQKNLLSIVDESVGSMLGESKLNRVVLHEQLSKLYYQQKFIYEQADISPALRKRQFIAQSGLIMSPDNCITTQLDDLRVNAFVRGIDQALSHKFTSHQGPLHIVYPACGPFAPLLLPLIAYYKTQQKYTPQQLQITLIDLQEGAVKSLEALVETMGIKDYVRGVLCIDALAYWPDALAVDMVILEAMQHGLSSEGQFCIARHFARLLSPQGCFIPQKISVRAMLNSAQKEFVEQWKNSEYLSELDMDPAIKSARIDLGEIVSLTAESLLTLPEHVLDEHTRLIECGKATIPMLPEKCAEQSLLLCSQIDVYGDIRIGEYDSGITHPLPDPQVCINFIPRENRPGDLLLNSGDTIHFFYRLNGLPGFLATCYEGEVSHD
ncbi:hypothetical protein [Psychromonas aquimarina]|uniref:hypothetical protein n=1 Tax=Psychromonas aquimarina TaxID=444919 RepID=UPI0004910894|nr:hypothetical protein [Psychromonas aquimarina]